MEQKAGCFSSICGEYADNLSAKWPTGRMNRLSGSNNQLKSQASLFEQVTFSSYADLQSFQLIFQATSAWEGQSLTFLNGTTQNLSSV
jgi:hypothetical protein